MPDIIQLLPDAVANQIAAGEVVQRPSSAVKELMENAVDAGGLRIEVYIADAGKKLIRVKDNGCGMSATDTRKSLERHATSKIREADDLFDIKTMGFRGEAVASIVAVSKTDIKSKLHEEDLGTHLQVEASKVISQEPHPCDSGTDIQIKNLFYNIPARRKFLKSNAVELKHIIDQFQRIALAYPDISFRLVNENTELFELPKATLRQRIVSVFGNKYNERLVPLEESTAFIKIKGFLCKPEYAKKKRGEQYFFINNRFIKSNYLHHAVSKAFQDLIKRDVHPSYFIYLEAAPSFIDINIHPTKTEAKFEDERSVYAVLHSTVRKALGEHNIAPSLDFNRETSFDDLPQGAIKSPEVKINPDFNPFDSSHSSPRHTPSPPHNTQGDRASKSDWEQMYSILHQDNQEGESSQDETVSQDIFHEQSSLESSAGSKVLAVWNKYIVTQTKEELMVVHIGRAYQRILYETTIAAMATQSYSSQQLLFPEQIDLNQSDAALMGQLIQEFTELGFDIEPFGEHNFVVRGVPSDLTDAPPQELIEGILENFSYSKKEKAIERRKKLAKSMAIEGAKVLSKKFNQALAAPLIDRLFACEQPFSAPSGQTTVLLLSSDELASHFK